MTRLVWLFLFINVYWWSNSSTSIKASYVAPPAYVSRGSIFSWTRTQIFEYFEQYELEVAVMLTLGSIIITFSYFFISQILFYINYKKDKFSIELLNKIKTIESPFDKFRFIWFCISLAIPTKIWITNLVNPIVLFFFDNFWVFLFTCFSFYNFYNF